MFAERSSPESLSGAGLEALRSQLAGSLYVPGEADYETARLAWNRAVDQHPALIVAAANADDVAAAVRFANEAGLGIAVQATGHGVVLPANDALLILTGSMFHVHIDPAAHMAYVSAGAPWGLVLEQAQAASLAPLLGSSPGVGAVGYTLGGGMGWLVRKYGLASDSVRYFDVVTAAGEQLRASANENSDLFWALRGGKGGLAIVTGMAIDLFPVSMVYGGSLVYPAAQAAEVLRRFRNWIGDLPEELTTSVSLMNLPPLPIVPEPLRGKSVVMLRACYCGAVEEGEAYFSGWRNELEPLADMLGPLPFSQVKVISNDPEDPLPALTSGAWLREINDEVIDTVLRFAFAEAGQHPLLFTEIRYVDGAKGRVNESSSPVGHRDAPMTVQFVGLTPGPDVFGVVRRHINDFLTALSPHLDGIYPNFLEGEEAHARTADGYTPETYQRLLALKAKYDPENRLRFGSNFAAAA